MAPEIRKSPLGERHTARSGSRIIAADAQGSWPCLRASKTPLCSYTEDLDRH